MKTALLCLILLVPSLVLADPSKAVITGPTEGVPGDLIELDSAESVADKRRWYVEPSRFPDGKPTFKMAKDGASIWLASRPGIYRVELVVSNEEGPDRLIFTVTISGGITPPAPNPGPVIPDPPAPLPAGRFGLANFVRSQILSTIPQGKRNPALAFSGVFSAVSAQIAAGTLTTSAAAMAKVKSMNQVAVPDAATYAFWKANVNDALGARLQALVNAGSVGATKMDDWRDAFAEIAAGYASGAN